MMACPCCSPNQGPSACCLNAQPVNCVLSLVLNGVTYAWSRTGSRFGNNNSPFNSGTYNCYSPAPDLGCCIFASIYRQKPNCGEWIKTIRAKVACDSCCGATGQYGSGCVLLDQSTETAGDCPEADEEMYFTLVCDDEQCNPLP